MGQKAISCIGPFIWNTSPNSFKRANSLNTFTHNSTSHTYRFIMSGMHYWIKTGSWIHLWWFSVVVVYSSYFCLGWNSCVISLNDNFVFLIGFCQHSKTSRVSKTFFNYCLLQKVIYISLLYVSKLNLKFCKSIILAISMHL